MQINQQLPFHLTYCTNVHAGESWAAIFANLQQYVIALKQKLAPQQAFGIGLRLSDQAATELLNGATLAVFKAWLQQQQLYVLTVNGFVYGHFHGQPVKDQVYAPDWSTPERKAYSFKLLKIISELTAPGSQCGFSSAPLSYQPWLDKQQQADVKQVASYHLAALVAEMVHIEATQAKLLHIDLEPEADCLLMTSQDMVDFFNNYLLPLGTSYLVQRLKVSVAQATAYLLRHVRVCYDVCHLAVEFEAPAAVFKRLAAANIQIGKVQISTALRVIIPDSVSARYHLQQRLAQFADATYLHQVVARNADGSLQRYLDLPQALAELATTQAQEWRVHFHLPVFIKQCIDFETTQADLIQVLAELQQHAATNCLEIETYTWDVLPAALKVDLIDSLAREYHWVLQQFK